MRSEISGNSSIALTLQGLLSSKPRLCRNLGKIRTDNAGELTSDEFEAYLESEGIIHQTTAPHTSQQNGVAERVNRTLEDSARANLIEAELPIGFWPDAVLYGAATRNFCPTRALLDGRIPEEAWKNVRQDISHLRPFGCECYVQVLPEKSRPTLSPKAIKCILLGYYTLPGTQLKAYKCYDRATRKVYKSRDVTFIERGASSGWTEVITDLRNLPPVIPNPPGTPGTPSTPDATSSLPVDAVEPAREEEQEEEQEDVEAAVEVEELAEDVVEAPPPPRTRRLPAHLRDMVDERAKLPKG
jgi:hypothetical protein